jgi:hypothetical protein
VTSAAGGLSLVGVACWIIFKTICGLSLRLWQVSNGAQYLAQKQGEKHQDFLWW